MYCNTCLEAMVERVADDCYKCPSCYSFFDGKHDKLIFIHVYPVNDSKNHNLDSPLCSCDPKIDYELKIVTHNAWDIREAQEYINDKLTS